MPSRVPMILARFCMKCSAASTPTRISGRKKSGRWFPTGRFVSRSQLLSRRHRTGRRLRALRDVEQILLGSALLEDIERVNQLVVVGDAAALGRRIAERESGNSVTEESVDLRRRLLVLRVIDCDALCLEAAIEFLAPCRRNGEIRPNGLFQLQ